MDLEKISNGFEKLRPGGNWDKVPTKSVNDILILNKEKRREEWWVVQRKKERITYVPPKLPRDVNHLPLTSESTPVDIHEFRTGKRSGLRLKANVTSIIVQGDKPSNVELIRGLREVRNATIGVEATFKDPTNELMHCTVWECLDTNERVTFVSQRNSIRSYKCTGTSRLVIQVCDSSDKRSPVITIGKRKE